MRTISRRHELAHTFNLLVREPFVTSSPARELADRALYLYHRERWRLPLRRGSSEIPVDRPIFLLGVQGGGLTLMARTLQRNPSVVTMSGNSRQWTAMNELGVEPSRMRRLPPALWGSKFRDDMPHPVFGTRHYGVYASSALIDRYRHTRDEATAEDAEKLVRVLQEHIAAYAHDPLHARFLDKTQNFTVSVGYVDALLAGHDPHFVLVVRDPYALAYRSLDRDRPFVPQETSRDWLLRLAAEHWANSIRLALEDGEQVDHFHTVRFEDFIADPARTVREICAFVGLDFDEDMLPQPHHRFPRGTWPGDEKWYPLRDDPYVNRLSPRDIEIVDDVCHDLAVRFGYELPAGARA